MSFGKKAKEIIGTVAPTVGTILGGPLGGLAGAILASVFGTKDEKAIEQAIASGNPEALVKLREAENELQIKMREFDIDLERINMEDRTSARHLAETQGMAPQIILSTFFILGYFLALYFYMTGRTFINPDQKEVVNTLIGVITTMVVMIGNFWFGSSSGSIHKTSLLSRGDSR